jgi:hypothetical protein
MATTDRWPDDMRTDQIAPDQRRRGRSRRVRERAILRMPRRGTPAKATARAVVVKRAPAQSEIRVQRVTSRDFAAVLACGLPA